MPEPVATTFPSFVLWSVRPLALELAVERKPWCVTAEAAAAATPPLRRRRSPGPAPPARSPPPPPRPRTRAPMPPPLRLGLRQPHLEPSPVHFDGANALDGRLRTSQPKHREIPVPHAV